MAIRRGNTKNEIVLNLIPKGAKHVNVTGTLSNKQKYTEYQEICSTKM